MENKNTMRPIGLHGALAVSLLLHAGLLWLNRPSSMPPTVDGERTLRIALQRRPSTPEPRTPATAMPAPVPSKPPPPPTDWLTQAREVVRAAGDAPRTHFQAPPVRNPSERLAVAPVFRMPALAAGFKPLPKSLEICGAMVESGFGIHRREMPVAYACADKKDEFRNAPAAANRDAAMTPATAEMRERMR